MKVNFYIRGKKGPESVCRIWIRISSSGRLPIQIKTDFRIRRKFWPKSNKKGSQKRPIKTYEFAGQLNSNLNAIETRLVNLNAKYSGDLDAVVLEYTGKASSSEFERAKEKYFAHLEDRVRAGDLAASSLENTRTALRKVDKLFPKMKFEDLTPILGSVIYSRMLNSGLRKKSAKVYIERLKTFLSWSSRSGYRFDQAFRDWGPFDEDPIQFALSREEVEILRAFSPERILDHFLFMIETGLRRSEFYSLDPSSIEGDVVSFKMIKRRGKTVVRRVRLNSRALDIWQKYGGTFESCNKNRKKAPFMFNQRLREILTEAKIDSTFIGPGGAKLRKADHIGSHTARRTFISFKIEDGHSIALISKAVGHSRISTTQKYDQTGDEAAFGIMD